MVLGILTLITAEVAFGEAQVVDGVQEVGLAATVAAGDPNNTLPETVGPVAVVFELGKRYVSNR